MIIDLRIIDSNSTIKFQGSLKSTFWAGIILFVISISVIAFGVTLFSPHTIIFKGIIAC